jgi:hypothetical protein
MAEPVIGRTLLRILEELVGLVDFLELAFGLGVVGVLVGMVLHGKLAESALELLLISATRYTKCFVKISLGHATSFQLSFRGSHDRMFRHSRPGTAVSPGPKVRPEGVGPQIGGSGPGHHNRVDLECLPTGSPSFEFRPAGESRADSDEET